MRVLYIGPYYSETMRRTLRLGGEFSPGGLNKMKPMMALLARDHKVTVLSTGYSRSAKFTWVPRREEKLTLKTDEIPVVYPAYPAAPLLSFLSSACSLAVECLKARPELVMFYNLRPETFGPAWLVKILLGARIICQFEDGLHLLYGRFSPRRWIFRLTYKLGRRLCDGFTLVNSALLREFRPEVSVAVPFILPEESRSSVRPVRFNMRERDVIRVGYAGGLNRERGADIFLQAAWSLRLEPRFRFTIAGRGPLLGWVLAQAREQTNLVYLGFLGEDEMRPHLERMDILVNPQPLSHPFARYSFPSKVMRYILLGKPIVSTAFEDLERLKAPGLNFFTDDDPADLARVLMELAGSEVEVDYRFLWDHFSESRMRREIAGLFLRSGFGASASSR